MWGGWDPYPDDEGSLRHVLSVLVDAAVQRVPSTVDDAPGVELDGRAVDR